jgi:hypothetical protein
MELNLICHLHHIVGFIINFDLLFYWDGIYLYLVIADKFNQLIKSNDVPWPLFVDQPYTIHDPPP